MTTNQKRRSITNAPQFTQPRCNTMEPRFSPPPQQQHYILCQNVSQLRTGPPPTITMLHSTPLNINNWGQQEPTVANYSAQKNTDMTLLTSREMPTPSTVSSQSFGKALITASRHDLENGPPPEDVAAMKYSQASSVSPIHFGWTSELALQQHRHHQLHYQQPQQQARMANIAVQLGSPPVPVILSPSAGAIEPPASFPCTPVELTPTNCITTHCHPTKINTTFRNTDASKPPTALSAASWNGIGSAHRNGNGNLNFQGSAQRQQRRCCDDSATPPQSGFTPSSHILGGTPFATASHNFAPQMSRTKQQCLKTKLCHFFLEQKCSRGDQCLFAHSDEELRRTPDLSKTKICVKWKKGLCVQDSSRCSYAHGVADLSCAVPNAEKTEDANAKNELISQTLLGVRRRNLSEQAEKEDRGEIHYFLKTPGLPPDKTLSSRESFGRQNDQTTENELKRQSVNSGIVYSPSSCFTADNVMKQCDVAVPTTAEGSSSDEGSPASASASVKERAVAAPLFHPDPQSLPLMLQKEQDDDQDCYLQVQRTRASTVDVVFPPETSDSEATSSTLPLLSSPALDAIFGRVEKPSVPEYKPEDNLLDDPLSFDASYTNPPATVLQWSDDSSSTNVVCSSTQLSLSLPSQKQAHSLSRQPHKECDLFSHSSTLGIHRISSHELLRAMPCSYEE